MNVVKPNWGDFLHLDSLTFKENDRYTKTLVIHTFIHSKKWIPIDSRKCEHGVSNYLVVLVLKDSVKAYEQFSFLSSVQRKT